MQNNTEPHQCRQPSAKTSPNLRSSRGGVVPDRSDVHGAHALVVGVELEGDLQALIEPDACHDCCWCYSKLWPLLHLHKSLKLVGGESLRKGLDRLLFDTYVFV